MGLQESHPIISVPQYSISYSSYPLLRRISSGGKKNGIQVGSEVSWIVERKKRGSPKPFKATGRITRIYTTTFGSTIQKDAAQIEPYQKYLDVYPGRKHTTISLEKLNLI